LIATPNVDKCKRRQKEKAIELGYMLHIIPMQNKYYSVCKQLGQSTNRNYAIMSRKMGVKMGMEKEGSILAPAFFILKFLYLWLECLAKLPMGVEGWLTILLCMEVGQFNNV
jgi:hypothetical protein